MYALAFVCWHE